MSAEFIRTFGNRNFYGGELLSREEMEKKQDNATFMNTITSGISPSGQSWGKVLGNFYQYGNWEGVIPGRNVGGDGIEYVVILHKRSWGRVSVPLNDKPFDNPLFFNISQDRSSQKSQELVETKKKTSPTLNKEKKPSTKKAKTKPAAKKTKKVSKK